MQVKRSLSYVRLYVQSFFVGAFRAFSAYAVTTSLLIGGVLYAISYIALIFGEDRALRFVEKRPWLTVFIGLGFMTATLGLGYWAWTTKLADLQAAHNRRITKLRLVQTA